MTPEKSPHPPVKVMRIITRLNVGGPARHVLWLSEGLKKRGYHTTLLAGETEENEQELQEATLARKAVELKEHHEENREAPSPPDTPFTLQIIPTLRRSLSLGADSIAFLRILEALQRTRPDILHTHTSKAGFLGRTAGILYRILHPGRTLLMVHTFHGHTFSGYFSPLKQKVFLQAERFLARFCDAIITISPQQKEEVSRKYKVGKEEQFFIVPLGTDQEKLKECLKKKEKITENKANPLIVSAVGRIAPVKNYSHMLEIAESIPEKSRSRFHFRLYGSATPDEMNALKDLREEYHLEDSFFFMGNKTDMRAIYRETDILLLTSLNEGTPLSIIEAFSCGIPVIASAVGGVPDLLTFHWEKDKQNQWHFRPVRKGEERGILCNVNDTDAFVKALTELSENHEKREKMGENAQHFARSLFTTERLYNDIDALYHSLLTGRRKA